MNSDQAITVPASAKVRIARSGPNRLFGDFDKRMVADDEELISIFDKQWGAGLCHAVEHSLLCDFEAARIRLQGRQCGFVDADQEQRQFRYQYMEFIVQFRMSSGSKRELTQLWKVQSGDDHPKTLWINFDSVDERTLFTSIADHLHKKDEVLGLEILRDFMRKFEDVIPGSDNAID